MNIFTYIQHLYTAIVLCKCVLTYIFSNYYNIHKEGKKKKANKNNKARLPQVQLLHSQYPQGSGARGGPQQSVAPHTFFFW